MIRSLTRRGEARQHNAFCPRETEVSRRASNVAMTVRPPTTLAFNTLPGAGPNARSIYSRRFGITPHLSRIFMASSRPGTVRPPTQGGGERVDSRRNGSPAPRVKYSRHRIVTRVADPAHRAHPGTLFPPLLLAHYQGFFAVV